jgi:hypothetical protein
MRLKCVHGDRLACDRRLPKNVESAAKECCAAFTTRRDIGLVERQESLCQGSAGQRRAWKKVAARLEFSKQSALLESIGAIERFDDQSVGTLRDGLGLKELRRSERAKAPSKRKRVDDDSIDGWRAAVRGYLKRSPVHRMVFAAAVAPALLDRKLLIR